MTRYQTTAFLLHNSGSCKNPIFSLYGYRRSVKKFIVHYIRYNIVAFLSFRLVGAYLRSEYIAHTAAKKSSYGS